MSERLSPGGRPGMCRNCGAIVAAGVSTCPQCGAQITTAGTPHPAAVAYGLHERVPDQATLRFAQAIFRRPTTFTLLFLIANILLYLLVLLSTTSDTAQIVLIYYGAKVNSLIKEGEWWRFVTPIFLHSNTLIIHIISNMYGLWTLGSYVERLYGSAKFVVFWIVAGVGGVVASYLSVQPEMAAQGGALGSFLFKTGDAVSVGASGALFGMIGVLFVFGIKFRHELPEGFKQAFGTGMLPTILINIFIGYVFPFIDNAAHLGGLVTGAALALVVGYKRVGQRQPVAYLWHLLQTSALALVAISFAFVAYNYVGPSPSFANLRGQPANEGAGRGLPAEANEVLANFAAASDGQRAVIAALQGDTSASAAVIANLNAAPKVDEDGERLLAELRALIERATEFGANRQPPPEIGEKIVADSNDWGERYRAWLEGKGVQIEVRPTADGQPPAEAAPSGEPEPESDRK